MSLSHAQERLPPSIVEFHRLIGQYTDSRVRALTRECIAACIQCTDPKACN